MAAKKPAKNMVEEDGETLTEADSEEGERWAPKQSASALTGIEPRRLHYLGESNQVRRRKNTKGEWEYALSDLEPFQEAKDASLMFSAEMIKEANAHAREAFKLAFEPAKELFTLLRDENISLRGEKTELLKTHLDLVKAQETYLSEAHARELAERESHASILRKQELLQMGQQLVPVILSQMLGAQDPKLKATVEFLKRVDRSKVELLLEQDFLDAEEKELLRKAMGLTPTPHQSNDSEQQTA